MTGRTRCGRSSDRIPALVDGRLSPAETEETLAHAASCPECRERLAAERRTKEALGRLATAAGPRADATPPPELLGRLLEIPDLTWVDPPHAPVLLGRRLLAMSAAASTLALSTLGAAWLLGAPPGGVATASDGTAAGPETLFDEHAALVAGLPWAGEPTSEPATDLAMASSTAEIAFDAPGGGVPGALAAAQDPIAVALLLRALRAERQWSYSGLKAVSAWAPASTTSRFVEVTHQAGGETTSVAKGTAADDGTVTLTPPAPGDSEALSALLRTYVVSRGDEEAVAGRPAVVVDARRSDGSSVTFWLDRESGLLLRREVGDAEGRVTKAWAYVSVAVSQPAKAFAAVEPTQTRSGWSSVETASVDRAAWDCPDLSTEGLTLVSAAEAERGDGATVMHLAYTDGVSTLSVFEQPGSAAAPGEGSRSLSVDGHAVYVTAGATPAVTWAADGTVYTVLGDVPPQVMSRVVMALPAQPVPAAAGVTDRIGRGLARMGAALDPTG